MLSASARPDAFAPSAPLLVLAALALAAGAEAADDPASSTGSTTSISANHRHAPARREQRRRDRDDGYKINVRDLRVEAGTFAKPYHVTERFEGTGSLISRPDGDYGYDVSGPAAQRFAATWHGAHLHTYGGFVWSFGFEYVRGKYTAPVRIFSSDPEKLDYSFYGPCVQFGYGYAITGWLHAELCAVVGGGGGKSGWTSFEQGHKDATGIAGDIGGRLGIYACALEHLVAGVQVDYTHWTALVDTPDDFVQSKLQIKARGWGVQGALGVRF